MTWLDDATLMGIENDLDAAHKSMAGDLKAPSVSRMTRTGIRAAEVLLPAFGISYANAKAPSGEVMIGKMPLDLGLAVGIGLLSLFDVAGGYEDDLLNVALGFGSAYAARAGAALGFGAAKKTSTSGIPEITGASVGMGGQAQITGGAGYGYGVGATPPGTQRFTVQRSG